ncbi:MAG: DUF3267 domain-containing protein [Bacteroidales bacterium]|nr:DUF3267 domain-containing protein [Bacteroidales bacterium]
MFLPQPDIDTDEKGRKVYILPMRYANRFALILLIPVALFLGLPFYLVYGENILLVFRSGSFLLLFVVVTVGIVIHELLHGLVWSFFTREGFRAIRFGVKWDLLAPYCHCRQGLKVWQYVAGSAAPLIILGFVPVLWAFLTGNALVMFYGCFFIIGAAGDILSIWMLRGFRHNQVILDHPEELGYIVEDPESED